MHQGYEVLKDRSEMSPVVIKVNESAGSSKFSHVADLDRFFMEVYKYYTAYGFTSILIQGVLNIITCILIFVVLPIAFTCLSDDKTEPARIFDIFGPYQKCGTSWPTLMILTIVIGSLVSFFWTLILIKQLLYVRFIKEFYNEALGVADNELSNLTFQDIIKKLQVAQLTLKMCINTRELSELHIYQRILRRQNYLTALVNKLYLPPRLNFPIIGTVIYWPSGFQFIIYLLFFTGPIAVFKNSYQLRDEYKQRSERIVLKKRFEKLCLCLCVILLLLSPFIFIWELAHALFTYVEAFKRDPAYFGARIWSSHAKLYLRHFNELDHELYTRLRTAYKPAKKYLSSFNFPCQNIIAGFLCKTFACISVLLYYVACRYIELPSIVIWFVSIFATLAIFFYSFTSNESHLVDHEKFLSKAVENIHYLPIPWQGRAHTTTVRNEFQQLFQLTAGSIILNLLSPLLSPFILYTHVYRQAEKLIDFFREFTVDVDNIGDVCSYSLMNIKKHGDPNWQFGTKKVKERDETTETKDGKTELSLIHFTHKNPNWSPPRDAKEFLSNFQDETKHMDGFGKANSMSTNAIYLHNQHHLHVPDCYLPAQENTPLL